MSEQQKPGTFKKGDPRINRKGRPKSFDKLRALAQQIAHEIAQKDGKPLVIDGHIVTVAEAVLRKWIQSGNPQLQRAFMEIAFGKVPDAVDITSNGKDLFSGVEKILDKVYGNDES